MTGKRRLTDEQRAANRKASQIAADRKRAERKNAARRTGMRAVIASQTPEPVKSTIRGSTSTEWEAAGGKVEVLPSKYVPPVAYPRPMFRRGKGSE